MKRFLSMGIIIVTFSTLIGCDKVPKANDMLIESVDLTKEENSIVTLIGNSMDYKIYDYKVSDKVKTININYYKLDDEGKWVKSGGSIMNSESLDGRIAISKSKINGQVDFSIQAEEGMSTLTTNPEIFDNKEYNSKGIIWEENLEIVLEKEIPLMIEVKTNSNSIEGLGSTSFIESERLKGYEYVFAVTITFSEKEMN